MFLSRRVETRSEVHPFLHPFLNSAFILSRWRRDVDMYVASHFHLVARLRMLGNSFFPATFLRVVVRN
jgi:hypothetical protein